MIKPERVKQRAVAIRLDCPHCGAVKGGGRHSIRNRVVQHLGVERPCYLELQYSYHQCRVCFRFFTNPGGSRGGGNYSDAVKDKVLEIIRAGATAAECSKRMREDYYVDVPSTTIHDWKVSSGYVQLGKKGLAARRKSSAKTV
jgi:hypothetical protein